MPSRIRKIDIWTVTGCNSKKDLENWVNVVLSECVFSDMEDEIKAKWKTNEAFVKDLTAKLIDGTILIDESWEDCEDAMNIESAAYDLASGDPFGTHAGNIAAMLNGSPTGSASNEPARQKPKESDIKKFQKDFQAKLDDIRKWILANFPGGVPNNDSTYFDTEIADFKQAVDDAIAPWS